MSFTFSAGEKFAQQLDANDPLPSFRDRFHLPLRNNGEPLIYFAGNSLGLMPKSAKQIVEQELEDWARLGVDAHLKGKTPWYSYHETLREPTARLVGAQPSEVICMNSLTVNLHLMMATFYRPTNSRFKILMEEPAFPSDTYLSAGPGAVAGVFVHERHATNTDLPRLAGWFGNDPTTRFRLHLEPEFIPVASADGWQISNPPILSMASLRASLAIFEEAGGMESLRQKSVKLTSYLQFLLEDGGSRKRFNVITPREVTERGCQLSIQVQEHPKVLFGKLGAAGVKCDFREPNVIRAAPTPLYNTFHEVWRFANILG